MAEVAFCSHTEEKKHQDNQYTNWQTASIPTYFTPATERTDDASTSMANIGIAARQQQTLKQSIAKSSGLLLFVVMCLPTFGIAPYFKPFVVRNVTRQTAFVYMMFNTSLNKILNWNRWTLVCGVFLIIFILGKMDLGSYG